MLVALMTCGCEWRVACGCELRVSCACEWGMAGCLWL